MSILTMMGSLKLEEIQLVRLNVIDRRVAQSPSKFCFTFTNTFCGLFTRQIHDINPKDVGNVPPMLKKTTVKKA